MHDINNYVVETKIRYFVFAFVSVEFGENLVGGGGCYGFIS